MNMEAAEDWAYGSLALVDLTELGLGKQRWVRVTSVSGEPCWMTIAKPTHEKPMGFSAQTDLLTHVAEVFQPAANT